MGRWERWFAWHPVLVADQLVWMETVERTLEGLPGFFEYFNYRVPLAVQP